MEMLQAAKGIRWLLQNQNPDGGWGKTEPDEQGKSVSWRTALAIWTLFEYGIRDSEYESGIKWLVKNQNDDDGGWGARKGERSMTWLTAMAVKALSTYIVSNAAIENALKRGVEWLLRNQNGDNGWGRFKGDASQCESTALVIVSLKHLKERRVVSAIKKSIKWLKEASDSDGWYGAIDVTCFAIWASGKGSSSDSIEQVKSRTAKGFQVLEGTFARKSPLDYAALTMLALSEYGLRLEDPSLLEPFLYTLHNQNADGSWSPESKNQHGKTGTTSLVLLAHSKLGQADCLVYDSDLENCLTESAMMDMDKSHSRIYSKFQTARKLLYGLLVSIGFSVSGLIILLWKTGILNQSDFLQVFGIWVGIFVVISGGVVRCARISEQDSRLVCSPV
jgi:hypothetical protein